MLDINTVTYTREAAEKSFENLPNDFSTLSVSTPDGKLLREQLLEIDSQNQGKSSYDYDVSFAIDMYSLFKDEYSINNLTAVSEDFWRWLQLEIIPDIVFNRHGKKEKQFYSERRRIWLRQMWWYIHLSWQGDSETTSIVLKNNTTDTVMSLVDRIGVGYDVNVYREIMKQYAPFGPERDIFRRVMVLHVAQGELIAPELVEGGVQGYVSRLFGEINAE